MPVIPPIKPCPCGSGAIYKNCCALIHQHKRTPTPEQLMRARYSAYAIGDVAFIINTTHPNSPHYQPDRKAWRKDLRAFCQSTTFVGLKVLDVTMAETGHSAHVRFHVVLLQHGQNASFTENSRFEQVNGRWLYVKAENR